jgi:hypothetical protein
MKKQRYTLRTETMEELLQVGLERERTNNQNSMPPPLANQSVQFSAIHTNVPTFTSSYVDTSTHVLQHESTTPQQNARILPDITDAVPDTGSPKPNTPLNFVIYKREIFEESDRIVAEQLSNKTRGGSKKLVHVCDEDNKESEYTVGKFSWK